MDSCYLPSTSPITNSNATTTTSSSTTNTTSYRRHSSSRRYHPYSKKHLATATPPTLYPSSPVSSSSSSSSSSLPLFPAIIPTQTDSPLSSTVNHLMSPSLLPNHDDDSSMVSPFALFGSLPPLDNNNDDTTTHGMDNNDLGDIMNDDQIFDAFAQLPSSSSSSSIGNSSFLAIQSPPLSPTLVPQDLDDMDDFLLF